MTGPGPVARAAAAAGGWFVRPPAADGMPGAGAGPASWSPPAAAGTVGRDRQARVAVLTAGSGALGLGAAVALGAHGSGPVLVACWPPAVAAGAGRAATPRARRLAESLGARGLTARAVGRVVILGLPEAEGEAVDALRRAEAAAGATRRVLVLAGARGEAWDGPLLAADAVLVDGADAAIVAVAVARLSAQGAAVRALERAPGRLARTLAARAGLRVPGRSARSPAAVRAPA